MHIICRHFVIGIGCLALASGGIAVPVPETVPARFTYAFRGAEGKIASERNGEAATWAIACPEGIGSAAATLTQGRWPATLRIQLAVHSLESFHVSNGKVALEAWLRRDENLSTWHFNDKGEEVTEGQAVAYTLTIRRDAAKNYIEIVLPTRLLDATIKTLRLNWVDAFRG